MFSKSPIRQKNQKTGGNVKNPVEIENRAKRNRAKNRHGEWRGPDQGQDHGGRKMEEGSMQAHANPRKKQPMDAPLRTTTRKTRRGIRTHTLAHTVVST
jgi:hypothetical protein